MGNPKLKNLKDLNSATKLLNEPATDEDISLMGQGQLPTIVAMRTHENLKIEEEPFVAPVVADDKGKQTQKSKVPECIMQEQSSRVAD